MKLLSHFYPGCFHSAAMYNWDFEGAKSLEHDTVCVLYQHKPKRSDTSVIHDPKVIREKTTLKKLQNCEIGKKKYDLPLNYKGKEEPAIFPTSRNDKNMLDTA